MIHDIIPIIIKIFLQHPKKVSSNIIVSYHTTFYYETNIFIES